MAGAPFRSLVMLAAASVLLLAPAALGEAGDAERAREGVRDGRFVSMTSILGWLEQRYLGYALEVELESEENGEAPTYEIEWLTPQNHVIEFEFDARTGELIEVEGQGEEAARRR